MIKQYNSTHKTYEIDMTDSNMKEFDTFFNELGIGDTLASKLSIFFYEQSNKDNVDMVSLLSKLKAMSTNDILDTYRAAVGSLDSNTAKTGNRTFEKKDFIENRNVVF